MTFGPKWLQLGRPDPLKPLKNLCFPNVFHTFQEIATFAIKSPTRPQNGCPDPSSDSPATLFEVILGVLTSLGCDFWARVAPTWTPGPSLTLEKPRFPYVFHTFQEIATCAIKSPTKPQNGCPDPPSDSPATLFEVILGFLTSLGCDVRVFLWFFIHFKKLQLLL